MTISLIETVAKRCEERRNSGEGNTWADEVTKRMACTNDLPAEEAIYHRKCFQYFMKPSKALPNETDEPRIRGRPTGSVDQQKRLAFRHVIEYLENNDDETVTLDELYAVMESKVSSEGVYSKKKHCSVCCTSTMAIKSLLLQLSSSPYSSHPFVQYQTTCARRTQKTRGVG